MEINKSHIGNYLKNSVMYLLKSKYIFFIFTLIESYDLLICLISLEEIFFYYNKNYFETKTFLKNILLEISPYLNYYSFQKKTDGKGFDRNYIAIIIYIIFILLFYLYLFLGTIEKKKQKK